MVIYCISGLGADWRAFQYLKIDPSCQLIHIPWLDPIPNESMSSYAERMMISIDQSKPYGLMGMSFGGMVSTEIIKLATVKPKVFFLISSMASADEMPLQLRIVGKLRLHQIVPTGLMRWYNPITSYLFGTNTEVSSSLLKQILKDTDGSFLRWAIETIIHWKRGNAVASCRIHGSDDKLLPAPKSNAHIISGGGHFMIVNQAAEVSKIINAELSKILEKMD